MVMDFLTADHAWTGLWLLERGMAALYAIAFLSAWNQFPALLGERGLLPVPDFLRRTPFRRAPSLFHWHYSDRFFRVLCGAGLLLSLAVLAGATDAAPLGTGLVVWLVLWALYLSIVNVGQRFYSFGWESMLAEAGFFTAFLAPSGLAPSWLLVLLFRWLLFRVEVGAGLIKLRAGGPWKDFTALDYHHETQPMPNPLSRLAHHLPRRMLHAGVGFSHFVQVAVPFGLFLPQPVAGIAAALIVAHQLLLIAAGNYAWLNWLTVVLAFAAVPDAWLGWTGIAPAEAPAARPAAWDGLCLALFAATVWLSRKPAANLCSKRQLMNYCFNALHLVNTYGAFGSVTTERYEIVLEGTDAEDPADPEAVWHEYEFRGKPGRTDRVPPQVAPYHLRLDWLMWFLPLSVPVLPDGIAVRGYERWFLNFVEKLLRGDRRVRRLLRHDPFAQSAPPRWLRARFYRYRFTPPGEKRRTGQVWQRERIDDYLPPVNLERLPWR